MRNLSSVIFLALGFMLNLGSIHAQQYVTTFGIQYKPIVPGLVFRKDGFTSTEGPLTMSIKPTTGSSFGMVVRRGISKWFSVESGINWVNRTYSISASATDTILTWENQVKWTTYEIPFQLLIFAPFNDHLFLNAASGVAFNFYPSDIQSQDKSGYFYQRTRRHHWWSQNLIANVGMEYRTISSGYFYLGASYLQPFTHMATVETRYFHSNPDTKLFNNLRGNYFTIDFRYFFHEDPNTATRKKVRDYEKSLKRKKAKKSLE